MSQRNSVADSADGVQPLPELNGDSTSSIEVSPISPMPTIEIPSGHDMTASVPTLVAQSTTGTGPKITPTTTEAGSPTLAAQATAAPSRISPSGYHPRTRLSKAIWKSSYDGSQWGIHWYKPTIMMSLALCGFISALGHHLYNQALHGQRVLDPEWPQRFGTALAFFIKMVLVTSVNYAYHQRAWLTVRKRPLRIETLDCIFSVCNDPTQFFNSELFSRAFIPTVLAGLTWFLPLCAIASPASLTSRNGVYESNAMCSNIPILDYSLENGYGLGPRDNDGKNALCLWDLTDNGTYSYNSPSMDLDKMFQMSMLSNTGPMQPNNPCPDAGNCTYTVEFEAPSFKCESRDDFSEQSPVKRDQLLPSGPLYYLSYSSGAETQYGKPLPWLNLTSHDDGFGVFTEIPSLWLGYVTNTTDSSGSYEVLSHVSECVLHNTTYHYTISFEQGDMVIKKSAAVPINRLLSEGEVMAPHQHTYQQFSGYHATGFLYRQLLSGNLTQNTTIDGDQTVTYAIANSNIMKTSLLFLNGLAPVDFPSTIEQKFHDLFLSFLSNRNQHSLINTTIPCTTTPTVLLWHYEPFWLAISYSLASVATLIAVAIGLHAFWSNGVAMESSFSTIMATTRNSEINALTREVSLGAWPMPNSIMETKLKFGKLKQPSPSGDTHVGFGFDDSVEKIHFGEKYT